MICLNNLFAGYGGQPVLKDISFSVSPGTITTLVGPNGCGKTTLLRVLAGQLPLMKGSLSICGRDISQYGRRELARAVSLLPQARDVPALTVEALAEHGRYPHLGLSRRLTARDRETVANAMAQAHVTELASRELRELSGGQRQRAYIAMALAQDTDIILLDEPTTHLDLNRQFELLELIGTLRQAGKTLVLVLHDLDHALRCSDQVVLLEEGRLIQAGTPRELLNSGALERVFRISIREAEGGYLFSPGGSTNG